MSFGDDTLDPRNLIEATREAALRQACETLRAITGNHDAHSERYSGKPCHCKACETRRSIERALETYK